MGTGKKQNAMNEHNCRENKNTPLFWQDIFLQIYSGGVYSADEKQGRESRDLTSAQICANRVIVDRAFEKLFSSSNATVN